MEHTDTEVNNVVAIEGKKTRRTGLGRPVKETSSKQEDKSDATASLGVRYEELVLAITRSPLTTLPAFPENLAATRRNNAEKVCIEISPTGEVKKLSKERVAEMIKIYTRTALSHLPAYAFTAKQARDAADNFLLGAIPLTNIALVRGLTEEGLCWNRLPFDILPGKTPLFDELFSRMTNARAVKAWIASLFIPESYAQQYIYLYGDGNNGKSTLIKFIARCFGEEGSLAQTVAPNGDHWAEPYVGKRFVYFPDFTTRISLSQGPLKQVTGGDKIFVNPKNEKAFDVFLNCKLAFSSNQLPAVEFQEANIRRIIFAQMEKAPRSDAEYSEKLWREGGAFLASCFDAYKELASDHGPIPVSAESLDALTSRASREDDQYEAWFDTYFKHATGNRLSPRQVSVCVTTRFKTTETMDKAYDYLAKRGYKRKRGSSREDRSYYYENLAVRLSNFSS